MNINNLAELYHYFDQLVESDCSSDELFASSYLRGFIILSASEFGDDSQLLTKELADDVSNKLEAARTELSPEDRMIVKGYWQTISAYFNH